jgi:hypothetical protein
MMIYTASSGNSYSLISDKPVRVANMRSWKFDPKTVSKKLGERVSYFARGGLRYSITITVIGSITHRKAILDALHDDFERDIRMMTPGKIMVGEWYANGFVIESDTNPDDVNSWTNNKITFYIPGGFWYRDEERSFESTVVDEEYEYLDYPYDYPYDFKPSPSSTSQWTTESPFDSDFVLSIHGPCVNPRVTVNGYPYVVYTTIAAGETLVIDSANKTVMCGERNLFDARNKARSVFEKIPPGQLTLAYGNFSFDLLLHEERSEPKWS